MNKTLIYIILAMILSACAPDVGSPAWCEAMDKKDKVKEWTIDDATEYAKHCVFTDNSE